MEQKTDLMTDKEVIEEIIEETGRSYAVWGFSPVFGRIWAALYLKGDMTQEELKKELNCALSSISQSLNMLEAFGLIQVSDKQGRKNVYSVERSFQKIHKKKMENALRLTIDPMASLLSARENLITNKDTKSRVKELKNVYSRAGSLLKNIIKIS